MKKNRILVKSGAPLTCTNSQDRQPEMMNADFDSYPDTASDILYARVSCMLASSSEQPLLVTTRTRQDLVDFHGIATPSYI